MDLKFVHQKIKQAVEILNEKNIDLWLIFVRESDSIKDPSMELVVGTNCTWQSAFLINKNSDTTAILGSLDVPNMKSVGTFKNVVSYVKNINEPLCEYLNKYKPKNIAVNYSQNSNLADGLTHGMYLILLDILKGTEFSNALISSEDIISALRGRKSEFEIELMKQAIFETEKIFNETTNFICAGKTEKEVGDFIKNLVFSRGLSLAWAEDHCPAVFSGPDTAGAHSGPTDRIIEKGHIVNIDFGVRKNGYCSDMQRTWYILKDNETDAPAEVNFGFEVLRDSIIKAKNFLKPGVKGFEVDEQARNYIIQNGFEDYQHGLGHQIGRLAHDGGAGLFPKWERYGNLPYLPIEAGQVFTIEPRLTVKNYGIVTMEEMVQVTKNGCEYLSHPQTELILIK